MRARAVSPRRLPSPCSPRPRSARPVRRTWRCGPAGRRTRGRLPPPRRTACRSAAPAPGPGSCRTLANGTADQSESEPAHGPGSCRTLTNGTADQSAEPAPGPGSCRTLANGIADQSEPESPRSRDQDSRSPHRQAAVRGRGRQWPNTVSHSLSPSHSHSHSQSQALFRWASRDIWTRLSYRYKNISYRYKNIQHCILI